MPLPKNIAYVGVNDHSVDLFEGQYRVGNGMSYNSYVILDEKIAVMDTVDAHFTHEWLDNIEHVLAGRKPDYLVIHHMEPDHSANIASFIKTYPTATVVSNEKSFRMMAQFFGNDFADNRIIVREGATLSLGVHTLHFLAAPMVHWPEVMISYEESEGVLFSADAFGRFGALDVDEEWTNEARRYYIGIVGKYGKQVQALLKKAAALDIKTICPLHGPVLDQNIGQYIRLYDKWSSYEPEDNGVVIAYTSVYGNTGKAAQWLADKLRAGGCPSVSVYDLARCDMSEAVAAAFRYDKLVLATTTYNADIFPFMREFIAHLTERGFKNRTVAFIENGSWAPRAAKVMSELLAGCEGMSFSTNIVSIMSALNEQSMSQLSALADELCAGYVTANADRVNKNDMTSLFNIGYGLYVVTSNDGRRDNGLIVNTVTQVTNTPNRVAVVINKQNYSHHVIRQTGIMNVNCISVDAPFKVFENFGFRSGRNTDKFDSITPLRSANGLAVLPNYVNAYISLQVERYVDLDTHGMFICDITEAQVLSDRETMTYTYYQKHVKPRPNTEGKHGFVCKVCGYVYEGEELPEDFICPLCKHGVADFEPISN